MASTIAKSCPGARRATTSLLLLPGPLPTRQTRRLLTTTKPTLYSAEAAPSQPKARHDKAQSVPAIGDVMARRAKAGKLVAGIAAASDSDMFKGPVRRNKLS